MNMQEASLFEYGGSERRGRASSWTSFFSACAIDNLNESTPSLSALAIFQETYFEASRCRVRFQPFCMYLIMVVFSQEQYVTAVYQCNNVKVEFKAAVCV